MRKYGVVLAALLVLAGCGGQDKDEQFIGQLHARHVIPKRITTTQRAFLIHRGRHWCKAVSAPGVTGRMVGQALAQQMAGWSAVNRAHRAIELGAAVQVYCPDAGKRLQASN